MGKPCGKVLLKTRNVESHGGECTPEEETALESHIGHARSDEKHIDYTADNGYDGRNNGMEPRDGGTGGRHTG